MADIGGTNCRLALMAQGRIVARRDVLVAAYPDPAAAVADFLAAVGEAPTRAAFAVAGPTEAGRARLTNASWDFDTHTLQTALRLETVLLVNDLAAQARAVPFALEDGVVWLGPKGPMHGVVTVVGPGTGLGVARLYLGSSPTVEATEAGHVGFAPSDEVERRLLSLWADEGLRVTNEHVLSGPGLVRLYKGLGALERAKAKDWAPPDILRAGLEGLDPIAALAVERFAAILGAVCADLALAQGAQGIAMVGAVANALRDVLTRPGFRARFDARGPHPAHLAAHPCALITAPDLGLIGAAALLEDHRAKDLR